MANWPQGEQDCPIVYTLAIVGGKWKWLIIYALAEQGVLRYSQLKKSIPNITHKMLAQELKELEAEQLVFRNEYPQIPPKVEYSLTAKGETLIPILDRMAEWGRSNMTLRSTSQLEQSILN